MVAESSGAVLGSVSGCLDVCCGSFAWCHWACEDGMLVHELGVDGCGVDWLGMVVSEGSGGAVELVDCADLLADSAGVKVGMIGVSGACVGAKLGHDFGAPSVGFLQGGLGACEGAGDGVELLGVVVGAVVAVLVVSGVVLIGSCAMR